MNLKGYVVDRIVLVDLGRNREVLHLEDHVAGCGGFFVDLKLYGTSYHHVGQFLLVGILGVYGSYVFTFTKYRNAVGYFHNFV